VSSRSQLAAGVIENTQQNLRQWIEDPQSIKQGTTMFRDAKIYSDPNRKLSDAELSALVAYIQTLK
jgi:cytochrome c oxidase subunit 2